MIVTNQNDQITGPIASHQLTNAASGALESLCPGTTHTSLSTRDQLHYCWKMSADHPFMNQHSSHPCMLLLLGRFRSFLAHFCQLGVAG
jgi:hypothetical protein